MNHNKGKAGPNEMVSDIFGRIFCCAATTNDHARPDVPLFDLKNHRHSIASNSILQGGINVDALLQMKSKHLAALTPTKRTPPGAPVKPTCSKSSSSTDIRSSRSKRDASSSPRTNITDSSRVEMREIRTVPFELAHVISPISSNGTVSTASIHSESSREDDDLCLLITDDDSLDSSIVYPIIDGEIGRFDIDDVEQSNMDDNYETGFPPALQLARVFSSPSLSHDVDFANDVVAEVDKEREASPKILLDPPTIAPHTIQKRSRRKPTQRSNSENHLYTFYNRSDFHCIQGRSDESSAYELKFDDISKRVKTYEQNLVMHREQNTLFGQ